LVGGRWFKDWATCQITLRSLTERGLCLAQKYINIFSAEKIVGENFAKF
jgi:hypothetical protein